MKRSFEFRWVQFFLNFHVDRPIWRQMHYNQLHLWVSWMFYMKHVFSTELLLTYIFEFNKEFGTWAYCTVALPYVHCYHFSLEPLFKRDEAVVALLLHCKPLLHSKQLLNCKLLLHCKLLLRYCLQITGVPDRTCRCIRILLSHY